RRRNGSGSPGAGCCAEAALAAPTNRARPTVIAREFIGVPPVRDILRRAMRLRSALLVLAIAAPLTAQEPTPAAASEPTPAPAADPVLAGAGDIADCGRLSGAAKTAVLLDRIGGTVFTLGDNAYESGTPKQFADCYAPTWGRHKAQTHPAVGNHEYLTAGARGYYDYFGPAAADPPN